MPDALQRQWLLLRLLPRHPRRVGTAALEARLRDQGYAIGRRSIQRDLQKLSETFPLVCDDVHKPFGWSWAEDADVLDVPGMEPRTALAFKLVGDYLARLLPRSVWDGLALHVRRAEAVLAEQHGSLLAGWPGKVRVVPRGPPVIPPEVAPEIVEAVYSAVLESRRLHVTYRKRNATADKTYDVHPLGLVFRDAIVYLVCVKDGEVEPIQLVLHRLVSASVLDLPALVPAGFDLDRYIESGAFGFSLSEAPIPLVVRVEEKVAPRLREAPLGPDQRITQDGDQHLLLEVTVPDTLELRCWLLGFGETAEVLAPPALREALAETTAAAAAMYQVKHRTRSPGGRRRV